jgi:hypothetical protein
MEEFWSPKLERKARQRPERAARMDGFVRLLSRSPRGRTCVRPARSVEVHGNQLAGKLLPRLKTGSILLADRGYEAE